MRAALHATDVRFVLLLDGLNELSRTHEAQGLGAVHRHMDEFARHTVHLTCRTADFDQARAEAALPENTQLWEVQPLADSIRHWDDDEGESDVRDYLRRHLGEQRGKRLYERLQADDRLRSLARLPLFLWMLKEAAGGVGGELPANRGDLVRRFVRSDRLHAARAHGPARPTERSLECLAWRMQQNGRLEIDEEALLRRVGAGAGTPRLQPGRHAPPPAGGRFAEWRWARSATGCSTRWSRSMARRRTWLRLDECGGQLPRLAQRRVVA